MDKYGSETYDWIGEGTLLADGLCIKEDYVRDVVPVKDNTTVYSTITEPKIRGMSLSEGTISVDFTLFLRWLDPNIKTSFNSKDKDAGFVVLSKGSIDKVWSPDFYILDSRSFMQQDEWASLKRSSALTTYVPRISLRNGVVIEVQYQIKSTVYCRFYPANPFLYDFFVVTNAP